MDRPIKKGPSHELGKKIIAMRDELLETHEDKEEVGLACKGMYKCDKLADKPCLEGIIKKLEALKKGKSAPTPKPKEGGAKKKKPRAKTPAKKKPKAKAKPKKKAKK